MQPHNETVDVRLKKGINKIVVKLCKADKFQFRFGLRDSKVDSKEYEKQKRAEGNCWPFAWHHQHWTLDIKSAVKA